MFEGIATEALRTLLASKKELAREAQGDGATNTLRRLSDETLKIQAEIDARTTEPNSLRAYWAGSASARW